MALILPVLFPGPLPNAFPAPSPIYLAGTPRTARRRVPTQSPCHVSVSQFSLTLLEYVVPGAFAVPDPEVKVSFPLCAGLCSMLPVTLTYPETRLKSTPPRHSGQPPPCTPSLLLYPFTGLNPAILQSEATATSALKKQR